MPSTGSLPSALARPPQWGALRHRNFRLLLLGQLISLSGTWMQHVGVAWLVLELTDSPFAVGLAMMVGGLPMTLFTLYGGVLADRINKLHFLIALQASMLVVASVLATLTLLDRATLGWILALVALHGTFTAFEVPTRQAFVIELVGKDDLMNAIALHSSAFNATRVMGPALAGLIIATLGVGTAFLLNAVSFGAVLAALLAMRFPPGSRPPVDVRATSAFLDGMRFVTGTRWALTLIILVGVVTVFGGSVIVLLPVLARDALTVGAEGFGALVAAVGLGALVGALGLAAVQGRTVGGERQVIAGCAVLGVVLIVVATLPWFAAVLAALAIVGAAIVLTNVTTNTLLQLQAPDHLRGRVMGFYAFVVLGLAPLGALQAGTLAELLGVRAAIAIGGAVCLVVALVAARRLWSGRRAIARALHGGRTPDRRVF